MYVNFNTFINLLGHKNMTECLNNALCQNANVKKNGHAEVEWSSLQSL